MPLLVVLAYEAGKRFFGNGFGKDVEFAGVGGVAFPAHQRRFVGGHGVAAAAVERGEQLVQVLVGQYLRGGLPMMAFDVVGPDSLGGGALCRADGAAVLVLDVFAFVELGRASCRVRV